MNRVIWINAEQTVMVEAFIDSGLFDAMRLPDEVSVATRDDPRQTWGPPTELRIREREG